MLRILSREFTRHRMPVVDLIAVQTGDPYKVLVSTILSSRTRDETTAAAAQRLFKVAGNLQDLSTLPIERIEKLIYPVGFYRNKARFLSRLPAELARLFNGTIPDTIEELERLPGVGRKTANLVVARGFNKPAICVDVHMHRIFNRLGYIATRTPFETEMALREKLPVRYWLTVNSTVVSFGQHTCTPLNPHCSICPVLRFCNRIGVTTRHEPSPKEEVDS